jgi:hypothetical protein
MVKAGCDKLPSVARGGFVSVDTVAVHVLQPKLGCGGAQLALIHDAAAFERPLPRAVGLERRRSGGVQERHSVISECSG